jgi:DNA-binding transcriptional LysR family regulator
VRISQPSASQHMRLLETAAGQPLVERIGRRLQLTDAGRLLAARAAHALATLDDAEAELDALAGLQSGTIQLGASTTPGTYVLPDTLACFARNHPSVTVNLQVAASAEIATRLLAGRIQLAILSSDAAHSQPRLALEPFLEDELIGIAQPGTLPVHAGVVHPAALAEHRLLARESGSGTQAHVDQVLERVGVEPAGRWELNGTETIKRAASEGLGFAILSRYAVTDELAGGQLEAFALAGQPPLRRAFAAARIANRPIPPAEHAFLATLTRCCAEHHATACIADPQDTVATADIAATGFAGRGPG